MADEPKKSVRVNKGVELGNRLFNDLETRKEKRKQQCLKQRVNEEHRLVECKNTTVQMKVPFKKALERRGQ